MSPGSTNKKDMESGVSLVALSVVATARKHLHKASLPPISLFVSALHLAVLEYKIRGVKVVKACKPSSQMFSISCEATFGSKSPWDGRDVPNRGRGKRLAMQSRCKLDSESIKRMGKYGAKGSNTLWNSSLTGFETCGCATATCAKS